MEIFGAFPGIGIFSGDQDDVAKVPPSPRQDAAGAHIVIDGDAAKGPGGGTVRL